MDLIIEILARLICALLLFLFLLPIFILVATPYVIIGGAFSDQPYINAVKNGYDSTIENWKSFATFFPLI